MNNILSILCVILIFAVTGYVTWLAHRPPKPPVVYEYGSGHRIVGPVYGCTPTLDAKTPGIHTGHTMSDTFAIRYENGCVVQGEILDLLPIDPNVAETRR